MLTAMIDVNELLNSLNRQESEICEFKTNNSRPELIGKSISALANAAAVMAVDQAYLFFGVADKGEVVGTNFDFAKKHKNQELRNWLATQLNPAIYFTVDTVEVNRKRVVVFTIEAASLYPVKFKGEESIRVGSYTKPLSEHPDLEKILWQNLGRQTFEERVALDNLTPQEVLEKLDYQSYFALKRVNLGHTTKEIIEQLQKAKCLKPSKGCYAITNLGALLMAKDIKDFDQLQNKVPRLIIYRDTSRINAVKDFIPSTGYIASIPQILELIFNVLPSNEEIQKALRVERSLYPEDALRELIVNALIHQDFNLSGSLPIVEVFPGRIEIRNLGKPLIAVQRFVDGAENRNELLAKEMRLLHFCEERGSGLDKVLTACEFHQLPPPLIVADATKTTVTLYAPQKFEKMSKQDKIRACYLHACLKFVNNEVMTNQSLRTRLGVEQKKYTAISQIIKNTLEANLIKKDESDRVDRGPAYLPYWG